MSGTDKNVTGVKKMLNENKKTTYYQIEEDLGLEHISPKEKLKSDVTIYRW